jgi:hypothetical protein
MMFVQPKKYDYGSNRKKLKEIIPKENMIKQYKSSKRGEPSTFSSIDVTLSSTNSIKKNLVVHALIRLKSGCNEAANEQKISAFTGFMSSISHRMDQSKPYYFTTIPKPPSKNVVYTLMEKAADAAKAKSMPFIQFVGDQPVYLFLAVFIYK